MNLRSVAATLVLCFISAGHLLAQTVVLSPTKIAFPAHPANLPSDPQEVTLSNTGNANLVVSSIAASGGLSQSNNCSVVAPGKNCSIQVSDISSILGPHTGVITISDNAPDSPQLLPVRGSTIATFGFSPSALRFGNVQVGSKSNSQSIRVANYGPSFTIRALTVDGDYSQTNNCPTTLATSQTCTVNVIFQPTANGPREGILLITSKDLGFQNPLSGFTAALLGSGVGGQPSQLSSSPFVLSFGVKTTFDVSSYSGQVELMNVSTSKPLTIKNVSIDGPINNEVSVYQISSTNCVGTLAPGGQCSVLVKQNPATNTLFSQTVVGEIMVAADDIPTPHVVLLTTNIQGEVGLNPSVIVFPPQAVGTSSVPVSVMVNNNMDRSGISLLPLAVSGDFSLVSIGENPCGSSPSFDPGGSCTLGVVFTPYAVGTINGAVSFTLYPECDPQHFLNCTNGQVVVLKGTGE